MVALSPRQTRSAVEQNVPRSSRKTHKDRVCLVREGQRAWIKHRDEGVKFYVSLFPQAERERRRLQFNGDATAARIEELPEEWE